MFTFDAVGSDYVGPASGVLTFPAGSVVGAQQSFTIQIIDDDDCEGQEDIALQAFSAIGQFAPGDNQCSLVIIDNGELSSIHFVICLSLKWV